MYIGEYEIADIQEHGNYFTATFKETATFLDKQVPPITFPLSLKEKLVTLEPLDANHIRNERCTPAAEEILGVLLKYAIGLDEINFLFKLVHTSLQDTFDKADQKLWGNHSSQRTIYDVDQLLTKE